MLILQRKAGESLVIGEDIEITVVSVGRGQVSLAIAAPSDVSILRSELLKAKESNKEASLEAADAAALMDRLAAAKQVAEK